MSSNDTSSLATPKALSKTNLILRLLLIFGLVGGIAGLFAYAGGWLTPFQLTPNGMINTFEKVNGDHPGFRRNHAKGVGITGFFESNGNGVGLSKAAIFAPGRTPIIGRFALAGGQPYASDSIHTVRSMALVFQLADGEEWRMGMNNIPVFAVNSAEGFYDQLLASAKDPVTGKPDPAKMRAFFTKHPESAKAIQLIKSQPVSSGFEDSNYNSLNAFHFTNGQGVVTSVRWSMRAEQPFQPAKEEMNNSDKNMLFDGLIATLHKHPLQWHLIITIAQPGDPTNDATLPWPADRQQVDVGTLTIDHIESEDTSPARDINFDPLILPSGIAGSDDPLLSARSSAYARSFTRRESEAKTPSSVSSTDTGK